MKLTKEQWAKVKSTPGWDKFCEEGRLEDSIKSHLKSGSLLDYAVQESEELGEKLEIAKRPDRYLFMAFAKLEDAIERELIRRLRLEGFEIAFSRKSWTHETMELVAARSKICAALRKMDKEDKAGWLSMYERKL